MAIPTKLFSPNNGGGKMIQGAPTVLLNKRPASRFGDLVSGHGKHPPNPIVQASNSIIVAGQKLGYLTCIDACKHQMIPVESDIQVSPK